ncbi:hypothetical protein SATRM34S_00522 [Streptomyces atroolivaceus]
MKDYADLAESPRNPAAISSLAADPRESVS